LHFSTLENGFFTRSAGAADRERNAKPGGLHNLYGHCKLFSDRSGRRTDLTLNCRAYRHNLPSSHVSFRRLCRQESPVVPNSMSLLRLISTAWLVLVTPVWVYAQQRPHETLFPNTTQGYVSVADVEQLRTSWNQTQLGQMLKDPVMKPFADDLRNQIENRLSQVNQRLGLTLDDLRGVPSGTLSIAVIQPAPGQAAAAVLADVAGNDRQAAALLQKIDESMQRQRATKAQRMAYGANLTVYTLPPRQGQRQPRTAVFFIHQNILGASDNLAIAEGIVGRMASQARDSLALRPAYQGVMARAQSSLPNLAPEMRWFISPFAYAETIRAADLGQKPRRRGKDMLQILASQGFTAIQGVGGYVNFYVNNGRYDLLHRTAIFAPPVPGVPANERYQLAARILQFPNGGQLAPEPWVPQELATYTSFNWRTHEAFEYSSTLVDAIVGEEGVFEDVIDSIEQDPNGPQINLRRDLVAHLGTRVTLITDYTMPITPKSERLVVAIQALNPAALAQTIQKTMETDPDARRVEFGQHAIWEIVEASEELPQLPELQFDGFDPIEDKGAGDEARPRIRNAAVAVANGQLYVASHIDLLKKVLQGPRETLAQSFDYRMVTDELGQLQPGPYSALAFSRTADEYRPTYELIRTGRMPEAQSLLGRLLNALMAEGNGEAGAAADGEGQQLRQQRIQGEKLPEFEQVRRYFGPAGAVVVSEENGWFMLGVMLSSQQGGAGPPR